MTEAEIDEMIRDLRELPQRIKNKIKDTYNEEYDLILVDIHNGYGTLIQKPKEYIYDLIDIICSAEKVTEFTDFKVKNNSYRIFINMTRGRISGQYKVENRKLVLVSEEKIDLVIYDNLTKKKRHHYVPEVYIKHFNSNNNMVCFRVDGNKPFPNTANGICNEHCLHELEEHCSINYIENKLSEIESSYTELFERIDTKIKSQMIDDNDKNDLLRYIMLQYFRHPDNINLLTNEYNKHLPINLGKFYVLHSLVDNDSLPNELAEELMQTHSLKIYVSSDVNFISSDMPVLAVPNEYCFLNEPEDFVVSCDYLFAYNEHVMIYFEFSPDDLRTEYLNATNDLKEEYLIFAATSGAKTYFGTDINKNDVELIKTCFENRI